jgi:hypothetical protein
MTKNFSEYTLRLLSSLKLVTVIGLLLIQQRGRNALTEY